MLAATLPEFHSDTIREIAINPKNNSLILSGGFDGNVFVTNISKLFEDIHNNEKKSENSVYLCKEAVGSVSWHLNGFFLHSLSPLPNPILFKPTKPFAIDYNVATCATDFGFLHIFDIRTENSKPSFVYDTGKSVRNLSLKKTKQNKTTTTTQANLLTSKKTKQRQRQTTDSGSGFFCLRRSRQPGRFFRPLYLVNYCERVRQLALGRE